MSSIHGIINLYMQWSQFQPRPSTSHEGIEQPVVNQKPDWTYSVNGSVPADAYCIDDDDDDINAHPAHVGAHFTPNFGFIPGMLLPEVGVVGVLPDDAKNTFTERQHYFALVGMDFFWRPYDSKKWKYIPPDAFTIMNEKKGLYLIGRREVDGVFLVGMIIGEVLYVRKKDEVLIIDDRYEILCKK
ncbi:uncharacterized protein LOC135944377 [Cloeon dipterum]|uniref:uncharacterized protein LOC135944377 n=1 Tax=Cloeon dipterum TaxID=197152 RepID=UPI003220495F